MRLLLVTATELEILLSEFVRVIATGVVIINRVRESG